jgi:hypothetical protein
VRLANHDRPRRRTLFPTEAEAERAEKQRERTDKERERAARVALEAKNAELQREIAALRASQRPPRKRR